MANRERGEVEIVVNEKPYTLRLTTNAICELENRLKVPLGDVFASMARVDLTRTRELVHAALQPYHGKEFSDLKKVGAFMDDAGGIFGGSSLLEKLRELLTINQPSANGDGANPPEAQGDAAGAISVETPGDSV